MEDAKRQIDQNYAAYWQKIRWNMISRQLWRIFYFIVSPFRREKAVYRRVKAFEDMASFRSHFFAKRELFE